MRDRLIDLIWEVPFMCEGNEPFMRGVAGEIADHLLANGVIVPPVWVGQMVYHYCHELGGVFPYFVENINIGF